LTKNCETSNSSARLSAVLGLRLRRRSALVLLVPGFISCRSDKTKSHPSPPLTDAERKARALAQIAFTPKSTPLAINTTDLDSAIEMGLCALENNLDEQEAYAPYFEIYGHSFATTRALTGQHVDPERTEPPGRHHNWTLGSNVAGKGLYALVVGHQALGQDPNQSDKVRGLATYVTSMMCRPRDKTTSDKEPDSHEERWEVIGIPGDRASIESKEFSRYYISTAGSGYRGMLGLNLLAKDPNQADPRYGHSPRDLMDVSINNLMRYYVHDANGGVAHDWERFRRVFNLAGGSSTTQIEKSWAGAYQNNIQPLMLDALIEYAERFPGGRTEELIQDLKTYGLNDMYPAGWETKRPHGHMYEVVAGISAFSRLAARDGDRDMLARMKAYFDALFTVGAALPSGWVAERFYGVQRQLGKPNERLRSDTGEINCSVQLVETAMRFGDQGLGGDYYQYAERALRAHVLPAQLRDVDQLVASPDGSEEQQREYANLIRGAFGFPAPYGVIPMRNAYFVTAYFMDITAGAVASLARIRERAHQVRQGSLYIPLLLDLKTAYASVKSPYSGSGILTIAPQRPFDKIYVRRPDWLAKHAARLMSTDQTSTWLPAPYASVEVTDDWIVITTNGSREAFILTFPLATTVTRETINDRPLTIQWRGDSVAAMSGVEAPLRFFSSK
jgi:hypothetical protein